MSSSQARREPTPACASTFWSRTPSGTWTSFAGPEGCGGCLGRPNAPPRVVPREPLPRFLPASFEGRPLRGGVPLTALPRFARSAPRGAQRPWLARSARSRRSLASLPRFARSAPRAAQHPWLARSARSQRTPDADLVERLDLGQERRQRGQVVEAAEADAVQEVVRGPVEHRTGLGVVAGLLDEAAADQR